MAWMSLNTSQVPTAETCQTWKYTEEDTKGCPSPASTETFVSGIFD